MRNKCKFHQLKEDHDIYDKSRAKEGIYKEKKICNSGDVGEPRREGQEQDRGLTVLSKVKEGNAGGPIKRELITLRSL